MSLLLRAYDARTDVSDGERSVVATITTDAVDRYGEVIVPKGIDLAAYRRNPVVLWCHDTSAPPIGRAAWIKPGADGRSLVAKVLFASTPFASQIFTLYQEQVLRAFSVGLRAEEAGNGPPGTPEIRARPDLASCRRMWRKTAMQEFSACPVGVNPEALALAVSKGIVLSEEVRRSLPAPESPAPPPATAPELPRLGACRTFGQAHAALVAEIRKARGDAARAAQDALDLARGRV